jgi:hypothetical protein
MNNTRVSRLKGNCQVLSEEEVYAAKLKAGQEQELIRQTLVRGERTRETIAYARFLNACENDATLSHGFFKPLKSVDQEILREWPFLASLS